MSTLKTMCCSRERSTWSSKPTKRLKGGRHNGSTFANRRHRPAGDAGICAPVSGTKRATSAHDLRHYRIVVHAAAGNLSWCLEPDFDQRKPWCGRFNNVDTGAWPCPDLWLDWNIHPGNRFLLDSQDGWTPGAAGVSRLDCLAVLDDWRAAPLERRYISRAMAHRVSRIRRA